MTLFAALLFGVLEGILAFLPISGSGHMVILGKLFGVDGGNFFFSALVHLGTILPLYLLFGRQLMSAGAGLLALFGMGGDAHKKRTPASHRRRQTGFYVLLGTLPLIVLLPFEKYAESVYQNEILVSAMFLLSGISLFFAERAVRGEKTISEIGPGSTLFIGLIQASAFLPGISRMGVTMAAGMACGLSRSEAFHFSLLLSVPATVAAAIAAIWEAATAGAKSTLWGAGILGLAAAAVSGIIGLRIAFRVLPRNGFGGFIYYSWAVGIVGLVLAFMI